ncbi:MAG: phosphatidate cytidylyltransferase [Bacteroidetes bacterium]|nr:phosphatidate cytidylyltransferase [Bacteroidota bacterium]
MKEITKRVLFAVPAAAVMLYITWVGGLAFEILFAGIALITTWEIHRIFKKTNDSDLFILSLVIAVLVWFFGDLPDWSLVVITLVVLLLSVVSFFIVRGEFQRKLFTTLFTGIYAPAGFLMIVNIREMGMGQDGFWLIISFFLMIWGNDVFAYFGGKTWGKTPLAPNISPNKTLEGFWFGFLGSAVGFLIAYGIAGSYPLALWVAIPAVIAVGVLGPLGDLAESRLKRQANIKDSSRILPGHGGFFDRFDSMIITAPVIYFLFYLLI